MKILTKKDVTSALITGLTTGVIGWLILSYLGSTLPRGIAPIILVPLLPVLWLVGVQFGYFLATMMPPFAQFGRFAAIGFANAAIDFGVLYLLIGLSGQSSGGWYTLFKTVSFSIAMAHSYYWNKNWAFASPVGQASGLRPRDAGRTAMTGRELLSFFAVSVLSLLVNVGAASIVVAIGPVAGLSASAWAGVGAIGGSAASLIFNFLGLRIFVFQKK